MCEEKWVAECRLNGCHSGRRCLVGGGGGGFRGRRGGGWAWALSVTLTGAEKASTKAEDDKQLSWVPSNLDIDILYRLSRLSSPGRIAILNNYEV